MSGGEKDFATPANYKEVGAMIGINTNITALSVYNQSRLNHLEYSEKIERLSSGNRINRGVDDPSGLGIGVGMRGQLEGIDTAIGNIQDGIRMLHYLDGVFEVGSDILQRMRDVSVRMANIAPLTTYRDDPDSSDFKKLKDELVNLSNLLVKFFSTRPPYEFDPATMPLSANDDQLPFIRYNGKPILMNGRALIRDATGALIGFEEHRHLTNPMGEDLQVGPNAGAEFASNIHVDDIESAILNLDTWLDTTLLPDSKLSDFAQVGIDLISNLMDTFNNSRAQLGTKENALKATLGDLQAEFINVSAGKSRIMDADMAVEIASFTKNQIKEQSTMAVASQANAAPLIITQLLGAIYDGLAPPGSGGG